MFELRTDLVPLLPFTDRVYTDALAGMHVKVRTLRMPIENASAEVARSNRAFIISASLCDVEGYAIPSATDTTGFQIAPAETLTIQLQGAFAKAHADGTSMEVVIEGFIVDVHNRLLSQSKAFAYMDTFDDRYPTEVPAVNAV